MAADASRAVRRLAVIGAGWAGLSAAIHAVGHGFDVELFDMADRPGGRARSLDGAAGRLDNGQHILIGAYRETLALMRTVGVDPDHCLRRSPLELRHPDGRGLMMTTAGHPAVAFGAGVLRARHWGLRDRLALLAKAAGWGGRGFRCAEGATVADLCTGLPAVVIREVMEPLCVAALNTPMAQASGQVFLRVLRDALFSGPGASDLLLPTASLDDLLPAPAQRWLLAQGARLHLRRRIQALVRYDRNWQVDGQRFDDVVLACTAKEAARLASPHASGWSRAAADIDYEPIVTVWLQTPALTWPHPMMALTDAPAGPAQFAFDLGELGGPKDSFAFVVSGAAPWLQQGVDAAAQAVLAQARVVFPGHFQGDDCVLTARAERRATFSCIPGLRRPAVRIAAGLVAAGDHVAGPYPATLEGAVRSGRLAIDALLDA